MTTIELPIEVIEAIADRIAENVLAKLKTEHDGCRGCAFEDVDEGKLPCCRCKGAYIDYWRAKNECNVDSR